MKISIISQINITVLEDVVLSTEGAIKANISTLIGSNGFYDSCE